MNCSFLSNSGSGFEAFIQQSGELTVAVFMKNDHSSVTVPGVNLADGHWVILKFELIYKHVFACVFCKVSLAGDLEHSLE